MIRPRAAAIALALVVPFAVGCHSGMNTDTAMQDASGSGTEFETPGVQIDNATIVAGDPDSGKAAFLGTVYNTTATDDELIAIGAGDGQAKLLPDPIPLPPRQTVTVQTGKEAQAQFENVELTAGTYVPVTMVFRSAGQAEFTALVVPPAGYYSEAAPEGTAPIPDKVNETAEPAEAH